jgi:hypothetical protein
MIKAKKEMDKNLFGFFYLFRFFIFSVNPS